MGNQFLFLKDWIGEVLNPIKKDIKNDHLHADPTFYKKYFGNRPQNRLTAEEIFAAYEQELLIGNEELAEWIVNRWVFKHGDLYQHFADGLAQIHPEFDAIESISEAEANQILEGSERFGAIEVFLFVVLNAVVFPQGVIDALRQKAEGERKRLSEQLKKEEEGKEEAKTIAALEREITRLHDKILGVQKKYAADTESLKKQIKTLQKKLHG